MLLSNGSLSSNKDVPVGAKECIWVITVPPKSGNDTINIVSFDLTVNGNKGYEIYNCLSTFLGRHIVNLFIFWMLTFEDF